MLSTEIRSAVTAPPRVVMELLGHSQITLTLGTDTLVQTSPATPTPG